MPKITIRFVVERDYEIDDMAWIHIGDALVCGGEIYSGDDLKSQGNIFDKPLSKFRTLGNFYDFQNSHDEDDWAWVIAEENEQ